ncbi:hypothetical protein DID88_003992 [Monilinia fructigena]|uniref:Uncharacterized protein n=1 Tax=Monilinia fructigena TaxID=38457 RepID=A0A395IF56_9HELO|nr:hypothetical protein DID88_003992 [Monilinia fructigena]
MQLILNISKLTKISITAKQVKAAREDRITFGFSELPQEIYRVLKASHELHIRWVGPDQYDTASPLFSRLSPGLHVFYSPQRNSKSLDLLCPALNKVFGKLDCISPEDSFTKLSVERFASNAVTQYYQPLESLSNLVEYIKHKICSASDEECISSSSTLLYASSLDIDFDTISHALNIVAYWEPQTWNLGITKSAPNDRIEVGILSVETPLQPEELSLAGFLTVVGEDSKPSPTLFAFPARHHSTDTFFTSSFMSPSGLHPTLQLMLSSSSPPVSDRKCHVRNVLAALRGDPGLYKEALAIFYKTNTFCLTERNMWLRRYFIEYNGVRFMDTSVVSLTSNLKRLYVKIPLSTPLTGPVNGSASKTPTFDRAARIIRMAQKLTHIHIEASSDHGCRTKWLALICDLIGPADSCPTLQRLEITWSIYMLERFGIALDYIIRQLNEVFGTQGRLEGALTGRQGTWAWEHRGSNKGKTLNWGDGNMKKRVVLSLSGVDSLEWADSHIYIFHQLYAAHTGMPSVFNSESPYRRPTFHQVLDFETDRFAKYERAAMWKTVPKWEFVAMRGRCEREQQRGSLIHHEKKADNYVTKWLSDQGFECELDPTYKHLAVGKWRENQSDWGNASQRGAEGAPNFVPKGVDIDEFETRSRVPSVDAQPTAAPGLSNRTHSALPGDWSYTDSDDGLSEGKDVSETDSLLAYKLMRQEEHGWDSSDDGSTATEILEDIVFCPGEARYQIIDPEPNVTPSP